jgi:hypothetical protein
MIGRTNTGGGGVGGVLTVTAPAGVTVSVSKDGKIKTKTANAEGLVVFKGLKTGTWQLTITDGSQVSTKPVVITADYSIAIAFFMATISITYPAGSTCTCSDGVTTLTAPDTSGTWECIVSNTGAWTISCTDGNDSTDEVVKITSDGQRESIEMSYIYYIVKDGKLMVEITTNGTYTESDGYFDFFGTEGGWFQMFHKVDLTDYDRVEIKGVFDTTSQQCKLCVWNSNANPQQSNALSAVSSVLLSNDSPVLVDTLSGDYCVGVQTEYIRHQKIKDLYLVPIGG